MNIMGKLDGKIAVVTGGSEGIGFASAKRFVAEGAKVVITGRRQPELDKAVAELGKNVTAVRADVSKLADLDELFAKVKALHGRIDVLMANAGVAQFSPLGAITEEHYDHHFDINVKGTVFTVQKALPLLGEGSSIIVLASTVGITGNAGASIYSATKAAIRNLARTWILDLKERKIRVNVLSPGATRTPGLHNLAPAGQGDALIAHFASQVPMGRAGEADEMGKAAVFLASDDSSYVNGAELFVDGGLAQV
jgi:NAD(P)-dependent dehydrogenase (short-subunit alcohol dehydrogenase family)